MPGALKNAECGKVIILEDKSLARGSMAGYLVCKTALKNAERGFVICEAFCAITGTQRVNARTEQAKLAASAKLRNK